MLINITGMPLIKSKHEDILRHEDIVKMIKFLNAHNYKWKPLIYKYKDREGKEHTEEITVNYDMIRALICILYLFGKRISEVLQLRRRHVWTKRNYLYMRFLVLKKRSKIELSKPIEKVKRVHIKNQALFVVPIIHYVEKLTNLDMPLFPGRFRPHTQIVKKRLKKTGEIVKVYKYEMTHEGFMSRQHAYKILKALNPEAYPHWFRHSLATQLAEDGFTAHELKDWFDWSRYSTAQSYVEGMPSMTERISKRKVG